MKILSVAAASLVLFSFSPCARAAKIGKIARYADGTLMEFEHDAAVAYCAKQGSRLPTIREYAELAVTMGAEGLRPTAFAGRDQNEDDVQKEREANRLEGYSPVFTVNSAGKVAIAHYYNPSGFLAPDAEDERRAFWSSSISAIDPAYAYFFLGDNGYAHFHHPRRDFTPLLVRCLQSDPGTPSSLYAVRLKQPK